MVGPILFWVVQWNIGYDWVLRADLPEGVCVVCYADDTLVLAQGRSHEAAAAAMTRLVEIVVERIRQLGLEVALHKSEAMCFHGLRNSPPSGSQLTVGGVHIGVGSTMKYLGLVLDSMRQQNFVEHFRRLAPKLERAGAALKRLLPNLRGPNASCRRLYAGVLRSMALYGAPVFEAACRPLPKRVPTGDRHKGHPRVPHDLRGGSKPPCRIAAVGSGGDCPCAPARVARGGTRPGGTSAAAANRRSADRPPARSHGDMEGATIATPRKARLNRGGKSPL